MDDYRLLAEQRDYLRSLGWECRTGRRGKTFILRAYYNLDKSLCTETLGHTFRASFDLGQFLQPEKKNRWQKKRSVKYDY